MQFFCCCGECRPFVSQVFNIVLLLNVYSLFAFAILHCRFFGDVGFVVRVAVCARLSLHTQTQRLYHSLYLPVFFCRLFFSLVRSSVRQKQKQKNRICDNASGNSSKYAKGVFHVYLWKHGIFRCFFSVLLFFLYSYILSGAQTINTQTHRQWDAPQHKRMRRRGLCVQWMCVSNRESSTLCHGLGNFRKQIHRQSKNKRWTRGKGVGRWQRCVYRFVCNQSNIVFWPFFFVFCLRYASSCRIPSPTPRIERRSHLNEKGKLLAHNNRHRTVLFLPNSW